MNAKEIAQKSALINRALGIFIIFFGLVVIFATSYTTTNIGFKTNLVAGITLAAIGCGMWLKAQLILKKLERDI